MTTRPIVRWPGGKTRLLKHLLPLIRPHKTYVEAFGGGLVNLYRHAQYHLDALIDEVRWTLNSREELAGLIAQPGLTGLQRAARFLLRNRMSFGGGGKQFAVTRQAQPSRAGVLDQRLRPGATFGELVIRRRRKAGCRAVALPVQGARRRAA